MELSKSIFYYILFIISSAFFGLLHAFWSDYSDYKLSYWIGEKFYRINVCDYWTLDNSPVNKDIWLLNSVYSAGAFWILPLVILSGIFTTRVLVLMICKRKVPKLILVLLLVLWLAKFPVKFNSSNYVMIERGLFFW